MFLFGFAKSRKASLDPDELAALVKIGAKWLEADDAVLEAALETDELKEVECGEESENQA